MTLICSDINKALAKANELKSSGAARYFRGQKATWSLKTTYQRKGADDFKSKTQPFLDWLSAHPKTTGLSQLQLLAIAQHYGFGTPLLDLTTSPRVAANFATRYEPLDATNISILTPELKRKCDLSDVTGLEGWGCIYCFKEPNLAEFLDLAVPGNWRDSAQESHYLYWQYPQMEIEDWQICTRLCFPHCSVLDTEHRLILYPEASATIESVVLEYQHQLERARQAAALDAILKPSATTIFFDPQIPEGDNVHFVIPSQCADQSAFDYQSLPSLSEFTKLVCDSWSSEANELCIPFQGESCSIPILKSADVPRRSPIKATTCRQLYQVYTTLAECAVGTDIFIAAMQHAFRLAIYQSTSAQSMPTYSVLTNLAIAEMCFQDQHFEFELVVASGSFARTLASADGLRTALTEMGRERLNLEFSGDWSAFLMSPDYSLSSFSPDSFSWFFFTELFPNYIFFYSDGTKGAENDHAMAENCGPWYALLTPPLQIRRFGLA